MRSIEPLPDTRTDSLPEGVDFSLGTTGMGCEINPIPMGCLSCPLDICKYDNPSDYRSVKRIEETVCILHRRDVLLHSIKSIAKDYGVSTRTIHRRLKEHAKQNTLLGP